MKISHFICVAGEIDQTLLSSEMELNDYELESNSDLHQQISIYHIHILSHLGEIVNMYVILHNWVDEILD